MTRAFLVFLLLLAKCLATTFYVDSSASGANNGTSWADAWTSPQSITGVMPNDLVLVSGGPTGMTQTYPLSIYCVLPSGTLGNPVTIKIGQDSAHNGTAIFNYTGVGVERCFTGMSDAIISGDAGDGLQHFKITGFKIGYDNVRRVKVEFVESIDAAQIRFADLRFGGGDSSGNEIAYCNIKTWDDGVSDVSSAINVSWSSATTWDEAAIIHDSVIMVPYRNTFDGFGSDGISGGGGLTVYNCILLGYPSAYVGGQHSDGWQGLGNLSYIKFYNNTIGDFPGYAMFGEGFNGGYTDAQAYNNVIFLGDANLRTNVGAAGIVFGGSTAAHQPTLYTRVDIFNNTISDYGIHAPIALNNTTVFTATFTDCFIQNNVLVNSAAIDLTGNSTSTANFNDSVSSAQAPTNFVAYILDGGLSNNYHLIASAVDLIGQGADLSAYFTTDADGLTRTIPWDIGAYKFQYPATALTGGVRLSGGVKIQ